MGEAAGRSGRAGSGLGEEGRFLGDGHGVSLIPAFSPACGGAEPSYRARIEMPGEVLADPEEQKENMVRGRCQARMFLNGAGSWRAAPGLSAGSSLGIPRREANDSLQAGIANVIFTNPS